MLFISELYLLSSLELSSMENRLLALRIDCFHPYVHTHSLSLSLSLPLSLSLYSLQFNIHPFHILFILPTDQTGVVVFLFLGGSIYIYIIYIYIYLFNYHIDHFLWGTRNTKGATKELSLVETDPVDKTEVRQIELET